LNSIIYFNIIPEKKERKKEERRKKKSVYNLLGKRDYTKESGRYRATMGNDKYSSCNLYRRREMIRWFSLQTVTSTTVK